MMLVVQLLASVTVAGLVEWTCRLAASNADLRKRSQDVAGTTDWTLRFKDRARYLAALRFARPACAATFLKLGFFTDQTNPYSLFASLVVFGIVYAIAYASVGPQQGPQEKP